jgi:hypothetical protein
LDPIVIARFIAESQELSAKLSLLSKSSRLTIELL